MNVPLGILKYVNLLNLRCSAGSSRDNVDLALPRLGFSSLLHSPSMVLKFLKNVFFRSLHLFLTMYPLSQLLEDSPGASKPTIAPSLLCGPLCRTIFFMVHGSLAVLLRIRKIYQKLLIIIFAKK